MILVTGGAGFIGTHLCARLMRNDHQVVSIDIADPISAVPNIEYRHVDIRNKTLLSETVAECDLVYHLAAIVSVPLCEEHPEESYQTKVVGTQNLIQILDEQKRNIPIVFASSAAVYGEKGNHGLALKETDSLVHQPESLLSNYARHKAACEVLLNEAHSVPSLSLRFFNVYGPGQDPKSPYSGVITQFAENIRSNQPIEIFGSGKQTRDFVSVGDICGALTYIAGSNDSKKFFQAQVLNLGSGLPTSIHKLAETMLSISNKTSEINFRPERTGDILHSLSDISKANEVLGWTPEVDLKTGIQETLDLSQL